MNVLFVSNVYPPEVAPLATRLSEHGKHWIAEGARLEIITPNPNYPEGEIYPGYRNRYRQERVDGIDVTRVPILISPNKGAIRRTLCFISFMLSAVWFSRRSQRKPDVVAASSPQFLSAIAGYVISRMYRVPFVLEIRDLWPDSIVAVGAMDRNAIILLLERIEKWLYRKAAHIVVVTDSFKDKIRERGVRASKISVIKNGVNRNELEGPLELELIEDLRQRHALKDKFVVSYVGTVGMAHAIDVMFEAAKRCDEDDLVFLVAGPGAEWIDLQKKQESHRLTNFRLLPKQPRHVARHLICLSDVSVVHLKSDPLFRTVIPSKIFESMGLGKPIVLGVDGEARNLIEAADAGIFVEPENAASLLEAVIYLRDHPGERARMSVKAREYVASYHDRMHLARRYWRLLADVSGLEPSERSPMVAGDAITA